MYFVFVVISLGWLDQDGIYAIPSCFNAKFSVAIGMRGASEAEWADYYGMFARSLRHLIFGLLSGYDGKFFYLFIYLSVKHLINFF